MLEFSLEGEGPIALRDLVTTPWTLSAYAAPHGGLRGGAPPQEANGSFWSFCHSVHDDAEGYRYQAVAYRFAAGFPFAPVAEPIAPLALPNPWGSGREFPRLNPAVSEVIYPCGAVRDRDGWRISYGINDERCAITWVSDAEVAATLRALPAAQ